MNYYKLFLILFFSATISACLPTAEDPKSIADQYWKDLQTGNLEAAEKLVAQKNQQVLQQHSNHIIAESQLQNQKAITIVSTTITTINPTTQNRNVQTFDTVLVLVDGKWKVDLEQTKIPPPPTDYEEEIKQLKQNLDESMQENLDSLDESFQQGIEVFNEALHDGSKEMGDSLLQMMNKLNKSMKDSIEKMKQRRQQQLHEQESQKPQQDSQQSQPDPRQGEGRI